MRVKARVAKSDPSTDEDAPKVNRLTGLVVEEVSIVDRAANKRKFLVVKNAADDSGRAAAMKISPAEKAKLTQTVKAVVDAMAAVSKALESAEEADGAATPEELTKAIESVAKLLGTAPAAPPEEQKPEGEVEKAGRKISSQRLEAMRQAHALLGQVIDDAVGTQAGDEPETPEPAAKSNSTPRTSVSPAHSGGTPPAPTPDPVVGAALKELTETVQVLVKAVTVQKKRIDEIATSSGGSRQVSTEKADVNKDDESDVSWPLDMNRPINRETTPVEKSFFG